MHLHVHLEGSEHPKPIKGHFDDPMRGRAVSQNGQPHFNANRLSGTRRAVLNPIIGIGTSVRVGKVWREVRPNGGTRRRPGLDEHRGAGQNALPDHLVGAL